MLRIWTLGLFLLALGLVVPWLAVPLEPDRLAGALPIVFAGLPSWPWLSYGSVLAFVLAVTLGIAVWKRGRGITVVAAAAGAAALLLAGLFITLSVSADARLVQQLRQQNGELASIVGQFGYSVPRTTHTSLFFIRLVGPWRLVATALFPGWYLTVAGGALLLANGFQRFTTLIWSSRPWRVSVAVGVLLLVGLVGRGAAAAVVTGSAVGAAHAGDYATALARFQLAQGLNPNLRLSSEFEFGLGQALKGEGDPSSPIVLLAESRLLGQEGAVLDQLDDLERAARLDPENAVLVSELRRVGRRLAITQGNPGLLIGLVQQTHTDLPADHYALGRILYAAGDYARAIPYFRRVIELTPEPNVSSSAYTFISLCETRLGRSPEARRDLLTAVAIDREYNNTLARSLAAGLYVSGSP